MACWCNTGVWCSLSSLIFLSFQLLDLKPYTLSKAHFPGISFIRTSDSLSWSNFVTLEPGSNLLDLSNLLFLGLLRFLSQVSISAGRYLGCSLISSIHSLSTWFIMDTKDCHNSTWVFLSGMLPARLHILCSLIFFINFGWPHLTHFRVLLKSLENITLLSDVGPELSTWVNLCMWHLLQEGQEGKRLTFKNPTT